MNDFLREAVGAYHNIAERDLRLILLQRGERILPEVTASLAAFAHKLLVKRGVEIRLGAGLKAVTANAVVVEDKQTRQTEKSAHARLSPRYPRDPIRSSRRSHCRRTRAASSSIRRQRSPIGLGFGRLAIAQRSSKWTEYLAAHRAARLAAGQDLRWNIVASYRDGPKKQFRFTGLGKLGSLGRRSAVAEILGFRFKGSSPGCCGVAFTSRSFQDSTVSFA